MAAMDVSNGIAEFVHRYQGLSAHRDSLESLIKVCNDNDAYLHVELRLTYLGRTS